MGGFDARLYKTTWQNTLHDMSHRILKTDIPTHRGVFNDMADMAESYWWWARNKLTSSFDGRIGRNKDGWTISEFGTKNVTVFHATDIEEEIEK